MIPELAEKIGRGEMPKDYYRVANTKAELVAIIKDNLNMGGFVISADCTKNFQFCFGMPVDGKGKVACANDEFLDDDETKENPSYRRMTFDSAEDAVEGFEVGGVSVWPWAKGRRFAFPDIPIPV